MIIISSGVKEEKYDLEDSNNDQKKFLRITILGVIIAGLSIIMQIFSIFIYGALFLEIELAGILFILVGVLLALYGFNNYQLSNTNPEMYSKWKDPSQDLIKIAMTPILIFLIATMLGSNFIFTSIIGRILPEMGLFSRIFVGLLIGLYVGFFAAKNFNLYKTEPEKYKRIVEESKKGDKESLPIKFFNWMRMEKTYKKFVGNYWQIFGYCIIGALVLIGINYVILSFITNYFIFMFVWGGVEQLFIVGGFITLQNRKMGFLILQIAVIWLIAWSILIPIISAIGPFIAVFLV